MRCLIVEDDQLLAATLKEELDLHYASDVAHTGKEALHLIRATTYDVILLDLGLPDINGLQVTQTLRRQGIKTPILILTGSNSLDNTVDALDAGADDYVTKPFRFAELLARVRALLRRTPHILIDTTISIGELTIDPSKRLVLYGDTPIHLRRKELDLLEYLARNQGKVVSRSMILEHVWNTAVNPFTNAVDVHIKHLRDQLERRFGHKIIHTIHGVGYRLGPIEPSLPSHLSVVTEKGGG